MKPDAPDGPDVPSPCVGICIVGAEGYCIGCFRTRDELADWWTADSVRRRAILERCRKRRQADKQR